MGRLTRRTMLKSVHSVFLILFLPQILGQRTYRRTCDCDYTADGRCAYTLLLPLASERATPTCPKPGTTEGMDQLPSGGGSMDSGKIIKLENNITLVRDQMYRQSWMLNQIQSSMISLQGKTDALIRHTNLSLGTFPSGQFPDGNSGGSNGENAGGYQILKDVEALQTQVMGVRERITTAEMQVREYAQSLQSILDELTRLTNGQSRNSELIQAHTEHLQALTMDVEEHWVALPCSRKVVIVDRNDDKLPLGGVITVSSTYNPSHGPEKARIYQSKVPGAWCPSKSLIYLAD